MTDEEVVFQCQKEIKRLRGVVRELEEQLEERNLPENKAKRFLELLFELLAKQPRSEDVNDDPGFWTDGENILCSSETEREVVADFLEDILCEYSTATICTGSYEKTEDEKSGTVDDHTGFHYITIN